MIVNYTALQKNVLGCLCLSVGLQAFLTVCEMHFPPRISPPSYHPPFLLHSTGFPRSANRRPATAGHGNGPRRAEAAFSGEKSSGRLPVPAEEEAVGELAGEEGGRSRQHERLPDCKSSCHSLLSLSCTVPP